MIEKNINHSYKFPSFSFLLTNRQRFWGGMGGGQLKDELYGFLICEETGTQIFQ